MPSWAVSVALHVGLLLALLMTFHVTARSPGPATREADVGIALKHREGPREFFRSGQAESGGGPAAGAASGGAAGGLGRKDVLAESSLRDPGEVLPSAPGAIGAGALGEGGVGDAGQATLGPRDNGRLPNGGARVSVFGAQGEGFKFVFVFDRSGSMGGIGRSALEAAKVELLAGLESLDARHQFQIIFYNQEPRLFEPRGREGKLAFGNDENKRLARRFIASIAADGGTNHESALRTAIRMRPDVIFFLTDADEPRLSDAQLDRIANLAAGIRINSIEFGFGAQPDPNNFLVRLARLTGGQHAYVDISYLKPQR